MTLALAIALGVVVGILLRLLEASWPIAQPSSMPPGVILNHYHH